MSAASTGSPLARRLMKDSRRGVFFLPVGLAFLSSIFFFFSSTSKLYIHHPAQTRLRVNPALEFSKIHSHQPMVKDAISKQIIRPVGTRDEIVVDTNIDPQEPDHVEHLESPLMPILDSVGIPEPDHVEHLETPLMPELDSFEKNEDVFHDRSLFTEDYKEMKQTLKIYVYPHEKNDSFANVLLPVDYSPGGNYASESYFKKNLFKSSFLTNDPSEADLFYLPFSIAGLRHDKRVGVDGIPDFVRDYVLNISRGYPFWNRSGGADHFYVACHSVGRTAMQKAVQVKLNAIQVVCSSSYFLAGYVSHKDASIPQIWPREGKAPIRSPSERKKLAFYAGSMNSRVRKFLVSTWENDSDISVHHSRLDTPYSEALLGSKFCIHAKGFEINTARIGDALYYGCVPVILADHYDLPYADILNWNSFAVIMSTSDIPMLKRILQGIRDDEYLRLQRNVMRVKKHFQWHNSPVDYDAFHMVMYELWVRRSHVGILSLSD